MACVQYTRVTEEDSDNPIELPIESDGTVLLSTLTGVFPRATGLKYYAEESGCLRGLRSSEDRLYPPPEDKKRKVDDEGDSLSVKTKKLEGRKTTDLIVLNLAWRTDETDLRNYFSKYGDVVMVQVKRHSNSLQSKGYGFIRFNDYASQVLCLAERHYIDGRWCDVRIPMSKAEGDRQEVSRKVHIGGITENMSAEVLRDHFSAFGRVSDVFVPKPFRSFAFVTFEDQDVAVSLLGKEQAIDGTTVSIGSAVPKLPPSASRQAQGFQAAMQAAMQQASWGKVAVFGGGMGGRGGNNPMPAMSMLAQNQATAAAAALAAQYTRAHQVGGRMNM
ncbi:unnamed protein product [Protopolystoma xenopodis]|uniref:RRM domain-containing protein n=1 Tax=Protopolystoma xenopodis TaxID=117903 RepID=A0A448WP10_9PLAT|nr:unnamed protein product [Protopolystoma xenopodis]